MLFAFIDESYSEDFYYVGALVLPEAALPDLNHALRRAHRYAEGFGIPGGAEFHAHRIMSGRDEWAPIRGRHRAAISIYGAALREIAALPGKVIVRGVNVNGLKSRYPNPRPPHVVALSHALEDVDAYAEAHNEQFIVIADQLPDQLDHARRVERYRIVGTGGYRSRNLDTLELPIRFGDSRQSPGLQAVDLIVYLYRRLDSHGESDPRAARATRALWSTLAPLKPRTWRWNP